MSARALKNPARNFSTLELPLVTVKAERLVRISSYESGEPHFGRTASHRFDDARREYGTSYFGLSLATAVAESLLHDLEPVGTRYHVAADEVKRRFIHRFDGKDLALADLTGQSMNILGAHAGLFGTANYSIPMRWSRAIYTHPADVDGILYVSRMMAPHLAVVLFDRGGSIGLTQRKPSSALASWRWPRDAYSATDRRAPPPVPRFWLTVWSLTVYAKAKLALAPVLTDTKLGNL